MARARIRAALMTTLLAVAAAGVAFAPPAWSAVHVEQYVEVPQCQPNTSQDCPQIPTVKFSAGPDDGTIVAQFTANANHCSDILVRFLVDNYPQGDYQRVGPSQTVSVSFGRTGDHVLGVQARGITGGCNTGSLSAWGGTVHLDTVDNVGPSPNKVPCKWRYSGAVVIEQDNGLRVELDQWHDRTAMGPAHLYAKGASVESDRGDVLGAGPTLNGKDNELSFSIAWFDKKNNHVETNDYDGAIDPQGTLRGTTVNNAGVRNEWIAHEHFTCS